MSDEARSGDRAIALWWIGMEAPPEQVLHEVRGHLARVFGVPVRRLHGRERPAGVVDPVRQQALSTKVLAWLAATAPGRVSKVLGVTDLDLYIPVLTFVFGEAQLGGRAAVVSTARLVPSNRTVATGGALFVARLAKEAVHELGHAFGLVHCDVSDCVMGRSASLVDVDAKRGGFCEACWTRYLDLRDRWGRP
jgi:archaemetzincin